MTPQELTDARQALGLKRSELARILETTTRTILAWEKATDTKWRAIPYPVAMLIKLAVKYPTVRRELGIRTAKSAKGEQAAAG